jgi:hypothetical protein
MPFDSKSAKAAAHARWSKDKQLAQPEYPKVALPSEPPSTNIEIAAELPQTINPLAGNIAKWEDPLLE